MGWKILLYVLIAYLALCLIVFVFQRKLLYLPGEFHPTPEVANSQGLRHWPSVEDYRGYIGLEEPQEVKGTVVVFHGNAGSAAYRQYYVEALSRHNLRVILVEYPGYGGRRGKPSEDVLVQDALEVVRQVYQDYSGPLFLWGESMGSGVVAGAVARTDIPIDGLVLFTPWDSLPDLAQTHYWFLPARWLVLDRYNNVENLRHYTERVAVVLAGRDQVVPVKHGQRLYDSITAPKKRWLFEEAGHNSMPIAPEQAWWGEVAEFVLR